MDFAKVNLKLKRVKALIYCLMIIKFVHFAYGMQKGESSSSGVNSFQGYSLLRPVVRVVSSQVSFIMRYLRAIEPGIQNNTNEQEDKEVTYFNLLPTDIENAVIQNLVSEQMISERISKSNYLILKKGTLTFKESFFGSTDFSKEESQRKVYYKKKKDRKELNEIQLLKLLQFSGLPTRPSFIPRKFLT